VLLPDDLVEGARPHPDGERLVGRPACVSRVLEQVHGPDRNVHHGPSENGHVAGPALRRLSGAEELLRVLDDDFARAEADETRVHSTWALGDAAGWLTSSRRVPGRAHLVALGPAEDAAALLRSLARQPDVTVGSVTLPRDADRHLTAYRLDPRNDWEWFVTRAAPPPQPGEDGVAWLADSSADEVLDLLRTWSPRHDAEPGQTGVLRWAGVRATDGSLLAAAAHTERRPGVPHLASVVTHGGHRGRGLGAAVTAWLTRSLLDEGTGWVTLGMYSDNDSARRLYQRLGFTNDHLFTSGRLLPR
jgi:ribosomal protein S18 acetylase RimI-like enzyme